MTLKTDRHHERSDIFFILPWTLISFSYFLIIEQANPFYRSQIRLNATEKAGYAAILHLSDSLLISLFRAVIL